MADGELRKAVLPYESEGKLCQRAMERYAKEYGKQQNKYGKYNQVAKEHERVLPILKQIEELKDRKKEIIVVAIDGRCASGKSTMAELISQITGASVVHMDDFYLPQEMRTKERLEQPGGNVHYERFQQEVMLPLKEGKAFSYRRFDCSTMSLGEACEVPKAGIVVVEGAYSCLPCLGNYADIKVFSDVEPEEQLQRIGERNGREKLVAFQERWIPMEERYFAAYQIKENADMVV